MRRRRVAVVTDSLSAGFYFPKWREYYGAQFGNQALHVFTLAGGAPMFEPFKLGAVREISAFYNDEKRRKVITAYVGKLLKTHDYVIRVDTDEFLIPEPKRFHDLADYVERLDAPYVTARGFDIFEHSDELPLQLHRAIIGEQRNHAYTLSALCKTAVTSVPLKWDRGFHLTSKRPVFDDLYLFHMKRADIDLQSRWNGFMAARVRKDAFIQSYYEVPRKQIAAFMAELSRRPSESGEDVMLRSSYLDTFLAAIRFDARSGLWSYGHNLETVNVQIPDRFWHIV